MVVRDEGGVSHPFDNVSGRVVITLFHSIAIVFTLYRLFHRVRIHRFSWDDWLAGLALLLIILYLISNWIRVALIYNRSSYTLQDYYDRAVTLYWVAILLATAITWCSRASLSFSITRILPPSRLRKISIFVFIACLLLGVLLIIAIKALCAWAPVAASSPGLPHCSGGPTLHAVMNAACDLTFSLILVALPLYFLWHVTTDLPKRERRLMLILFTSSFLTFVVCLVRAVYTARKNAFGLIYSSQLQTSISLIVCNLVVVIPNLYALFSRRYYNREVDSGAHTQTDRSSTAPHGTITTITQALSTTNQGSTTRNHSSNTTTTDNSGFELTRITGDDDDFSLRLDLTATGTTSNSIGESGTRSTMPRL